MLGILAALKLRSMLSSDVTMNSEPQVLLAVFDC